MKINSNKKSNRKTGKSRVKRLRFAKRLLCFTIAVIFIVGIMPFDLLPSGILSFDFPVFESHSTNKPSQKWFKVPSLLGRVKAATPVEKTFFKWNEVMEFCDDYDTASYASEYQYATLILNLGQEEAGAENVVPDGFPGFGTHDYPFGGTIQFGTDVTTHSKTLIFGADSAPLFNYVYDSVKITGLTGTADDGNNINLIIKKTGSASGDSRLFANHVLPYKAPSESQSLGNMMMQSLGRIFRITDDGEFSVDVIPGEEVEEVSEKTSEESSEEASEETSEESSEEASEETSEESSEETSEETSEESSEETSEETSEEGSEETSEETSEESSEETSEETSEESSEETSEETSEESSEETSEEISEESSEEISEQSSEDMPEDTNQETEIDENKIEQDSESYIQEEEQSEEQLSEGQGTNVITLNTGMIMSFARNMSADLNDGEGESADSNDSVDSDDDKSDDIIPSESEEGVTETNETGEATEEEQESDESGETTEEERESDESGEQALRGATPTRLGNTSTSDWDNRDVIWKIILPSDNAQTYAGVIGEISSGAEVYLDFTNNSTQNLLAPSSDETDDSAIVDLGVICGVMQSGSELNLKYADTTGNYTVTSVDGNAGWMVGTMVGNAKLAIKEMPAANSGKSIIANGADTKGYAGGLVGSVSSLATVGLDSNATVGGVSSTVIPVAGNIIGVTGAGGLFGYYENVDAGGSGTGNTFDIKNYNNTASVYGLYCGGLFGVLDNKMVSSAANSFTITDTTSSGNATLNITSGTSDSTHNYSYNGYFGGLVGMYTTDELKNSLILSGLNYSVKANGSFNAFGGAIGYIDAMAYVKADDLTIDADGTNKRTTVNADSGCSKYAFFGGLVGSTALAKGAVIDLGKFTLDTSSDSGGFCGGGVVGQFYNGILRLSGVSDLSNAKPAGAYTSDNGTAIKYSNYGQLVGYNNNVLVYALGNGSADTASYENGWRYVRSKDAIADDLGTWGEVVRMVSDGTNPSRNIEDAGIVSINSDTHVVTLAAAVPANMSNTDQFTKTALNIMLNLGSTNNTNNYGSGFITFSGGDSSSRGTLLGGTISLGNDLSLEGTGINGLMRDGSATVAISSSEPGDVGIFTGTFNGAGHTLTMATGEQFGILNNNPTEGFGQIYRHPYTGLFAVIGNGTSSTGTIQNLEVDGTITVHNAGADGMSIGGFAARSHGSTSLSGVTASQTLNYREDDSASSPGTETLGKNIGGFIGYVDNNSAGNGIITVTGTSVSSPIFKFNGKYDTWLVYGGAIGKIASSSMTVNIAQITNNSLTVEMTVNTNGVSDVGTEANCGGLIGYITANPTTAGNYESRIVNISNLNYNGCTIGNCSSETAHGFLGYAWLDTTTNIKTTTNGTTGLVVTDGTINNTVASKTAKNVGVMCYKATGKWVVDKLSVNNMSMANGAGASLGMIVNKAFDSENGLYLDILNAGYTLTDYNQSTNTGIKLPNTLTVYDEIAAYSASSVINGGKNTGVISIDMNTSRDVNKTKITETGTYQNKLSSAASSALGNSKYANIKTRYYYNLNNMDESDDGQNLLLWSINKHYASSNIKGEFTTSLTDTTLGGSADLTGLSFYPVGSAGTIKISEDMTITFDYEGAFDAESISNTDVYKRDPAASNQHNLMHSGLIINMSSASNKFTVDAPLTLAGTFLETSKYQGVLISDTIKGQFEVTDNGSITLDGITPKTSAKNSYRNGYLLIKNVVRQSEQTDSPKILIQNVTTTNKYTINNETATVTKSLIGTIEGGKNLTVQFSHIRLDSRITNSDTPSSALDTAYGTKNSIFTESTLVNSIKTDVNAVLEYNYTYEEDWVTDGDGDRVADRYVTYGKEVSESLEYVSKELRYYGDNRYYTHPTIQPGPESSVGDFSENFLPYVKEEYNGVDPSALYYREIKVNVMTEEVVSGCGTYNDPYIITDGEQLGDIAKMISTGILISKIKLPKDQPNSIGDIAKGDRWCTDKTGDDYHEVFKPNNDNTEYISTKSGSDKTWSIDNIRYYLANAYYQIGNSATSTITLNDDYVGLGGTTNNTAFRGVIVGYKANGGDANVVIVNNSPTPFIKVSNGSVVKNIDIKVNAGTVALSQTTVAYNTAYFGYDAKCKYYGGIIGEIMGGDNIIDNSYVKYSYSQEEMVLVPDSEDPEKATWQQQTVQHSTNIQLKGSYGTIVPVGGYVGVVVFGGLIFKNMIAAKTAISQADGANGTGLNVYYDTDVTTNLATDTEAAKAAIYVNPIVGRVINGYAVNETTQFSVREGNTYHDDANTSRTVGNEHTLKNGSKHYPIADINKNEMNKLDVSSLPSDTTHDGTITIPNSQAFFILSLITQSCAGTATAGDGSYNNSLSYGTYPVSNVVSVFGISHNANYDEVGSSATDSESVSDYNNYAKGDTASNTAIPYIIMHYTTKKDEIIHHDAGLNPFNGDDPDGMSLYIYNSGYYLNAKRTAGEGLKADSFANATELLFAKNGNDYNISYMSGQTKNYLYYDGRKLKTRTTSYDFTVIKKTSSIWEIKAENGDSQNRKYIGVRNNDHFCGQKQGEKPSSSSTLIGTDLTFYVYTEAYDEEVISYPARCVTSSLGFYDINLTNGVSYVLPDSYRGLGCVGNNNDAYTIGVDYFDGKGCSIDEDIYLNKFHYDNYLSNLHSGITQKLDTDNGVIDLNRETLNQGIGLFDSVKTKNTSSKFTNFTLKGSVNTEIFDNDYSSESKKVVLYNDDSAKFISVGGVCGFVKHGYNMKFESVQLNNLSVCGSCIVGGLLGFSGNTESNTVDLTISVTNCSASNLSIKMNSSATQDTEIEKARNAMGGFVAKVLMGKVLVSGTASNNPNVTLKAISIETHTGDTEDADDYKIVAGGLVGYAGNGCKMYNMYVKPATGASIIIGGDKVRYAGGLVGLMQPAVKGSSTCEAVFDNCIVEEINVNGYYAGGFYGGKWINEYSPYTISLNNCKVKGNTTNKNSIIGNAVANDGYVGGFLGCGNVYTNGSPNIHIKDCVISDYNIYSTAATAYVGGFIGYTGSYENNSSITCYIHDSSVEDCVIGTTGNYSGGAIGYVYRRSTSKANNILGYNIKLDNITSNSGDNMGAWIGFVATNDKTTSIQFSGIAMYVNGFEKNIGNWSVSENQKNTNARFAFADYTGKSKSQTPGTDISGYNAKDDQDQDLNVDMPKYPYVNINPQSAMGTNEIISGDAGVLGSPVQAFSNYPSEKTVAAQIYSDLSLQSTDPGYSRRYTTFSDDVITGDPTKQGEYTTIENYLKRNVNESGDRISTYSAEKGGLQNLPSGVSDFAVVVIANTDNAETTALINRYIQLVTNTTTDYAKDDSTNEYYDIVVKTCKYNSAQGKQKFEIVSDPSGLSYSSGVFALNGAYADSEKSGDTFTLVDVQFKDPFDTDKIAYHLYVPVYTIKQIIFTFKTSALPGTNSESTSTDGTRSEKYSNSALLNSSEIYVDGLETWFTQFVRFTYSKDDINSLLASNNLNWNYKKKMNYIKRSDSNGRLPAGTKMILVDPNGNADKAYKATLSDFTTVSTGVNDWIIDFELFSNINSAGNFSVSSFKKILSTQATAKTPESGQSGQYNEVSSPSSESDYDICLIAADGTQKYYRYVGISGGQVIISVDADVNEDYYLSLWVPEVEGYTNEIYLYTASAPDELWSNEVAPKKAVKNRDSGTRNFLIADLFKQTEKKYEVLPDTEQIDVGNREIEVNMATTIELKNPAAQTYISSKDLYHAFKINLNRYELTGMEDDIQGLTDANISAKYTIRTGDYDSTVTPSTVIDTTGSLNADEHYIGIPTTTIQSYVCTGSLKATIYANVKMKFDESSLDIEFPGRVSGDDRIGVNVASASNLSYDSAGLAYSSFSEEFSQDSHYYYTESVSVASLKYNAVSELDEFDLKGGVSQNYSRLGVNGIESKKNRMPINSNAQYDVSAVDTASSSNPNYNKYKIRLALTLYRKKDVVNLVTQEVVGANYDQENTISDYVIFGDIKSGTATFEPVQSLSSASIYYYEADAIDCDQDVLQPGYYRINIPFEVKTGEDFKKYANYQVYLQVEMIDENGRVIDNTVAKDYLVYTNAKVYAEFIPNAQPINSP